MTIDGEVLGVTKQNVDVIVVGSGLTGGWVTKQLSQAGLTVLVLEAGPVLKPSDIKRQENRSESVKRQPIQSRHGAYWMYNPHLFVDDVDHPYMTTSDSEYTWIRGRQLGGRSLVWGGVTLRFSDYEFLASHRDGIGIAWPITYADLKPGYDIVESFFHVEGSTEGLPQLPDGIFCTPPELTGTERAFKQVVERLWQDRRVIIGRGVPLAPETTDADSLEWEAKTSLHSVLRCGLSTGNVSVRPNSIVSHLIPDCDGTRVKGVACIDRETGAAFELFAGVIVLCASTIESIRIMLNSKSRSYPDGIGNTSGLLGRYLLDHLACWKAGPIAPSREGGRVYPVGGANSILLPRFRNMHDGAGNYVRGFGIWGAMQRASSKSHRGQHWFLQGICETLPRYENRVTLDDSVCDAWGIKVPRIEFSYSSNELAMRDDALTCIREMCGAANLNVEHEGQMRPGQYVHELGGARMGESRETSVLNRFNQCWETRNLFVVDGSCFTTSGWQNPSLTMMALAVRASAFIVQEMRNKSL